MSGFLNTEDPITLRPLTNYSSNSIIKIGSHGFYIPTIQSWVAQFPYNVVPTHPLTREPIENVDKLLYVAKSKWIKSLYREDLIRRIGEPTIQIIVKRPFIHGCMCIDTHPDEDIMVVLRVVSDICGNRYTECIGGSYCGMPFMRNRTLSDYHIQEMSTITCFGMFGNAQLYSHIPTFYPKELE